LEKTEKIKILYVDDEPNNLTCFKANFRFDYHVLIAQTVGQAYDFLVKEPEIRVILCDQRMPEKTGVQFYEEIRHEFPNPIRMLITGYTDIESVIDAINRGHIFRYIKKPWTDADIRSAIDEANKFYITNSMLVAKNKELQAAYDDLGKFAYSVTHDLRGPLLSIQGALDIANFSDDLDEVKEIMGMMGVALKKLDEFIRNLHDYYSIKRGKILFEQLDFPAIVQDVESFFLLAERTDNIKFNFSFEQDAPFCSDEMSIKLILNNLLSNAFKYQRRSNELKSVDLRIKVSNNVATIVVKDNGIGIQEKHIDNIFTMFYRATTEETGSGFGLYNVKDALCRLNGNIEVQSVFNEGTTFIVTIPGKGNASN
jgi:signal transduction histidine kinase